MLIINFKFSTWRDHLYIGAQGLYYSAKKYSNVSFIEKHEPRCLRSQFNRPWKKRLILEWHCDNSDPDSRPDILPSQWRTSSATKRRVGGTTGLRRPASRRPEMPPLLSSATPSRLHVSPKYIWLNRICWRNGFRILYLFVRPIICKATQHSVLSEKKKY